MLLNGLSAWLQDAGRIARREVRSLFATPVALLFIAAFLLISLFVVFWVETFFARNLADIKPLFEWMPLLLLLLVATLTMRAWSEERRSGTLEVLLTSPVSPSALVMGKFLATLVPVAIALLLTLPLPWLTQSLGQLDWGPVWGGYLAALCLAATYSALGLWLSSRSDNPLVSLMGTLLVGALLYWLGSPLLTDLFPYQVAEWLRSLGTGSRFSDITRGVLDWRDLYYYLGLTALFLVLNRLELERHYWAGQSAGGSQWRWRLGSALLALNLLVANAWLYPLQGIRLDLTEGKRYTLSEATRHTLSQLQEPVLIRGYFSANTHPLLAPLVPQLQDLLQEYALAGGSKVRLQWVDPQQDPQLEEEAGSKYGIRPVPFQTANRYQAAVVNAYFDVLISYGNEYQVLGFRDLIDVKAKGEGQLEVELKNPEYDLTQALRKVVASYQGQGELWAELPRPVQLSAYVSAALPESVQPLRQALEQALASMQQAGQDKFSFEFIDPSQDQGLAKQLAEEQGWQPMITDLLNPQPFWFHLLLSDGQSSWPVALPDQLDQQGWQQSLEASIKRFKPGSLKSVAVYRPTASPYSQAPNFSLLRDYLGEQVRWLDTDLKQGQVPAGAEMLLVLAPDNLDERQQYAIDQFLMRGGTVVLASSTAKVELGQRLQASWNPTGLEDWLASMGIKQPQAWVLDQQSGALPIPVERQLGSFRVQEIQLLQYPLIVDARAEQLNAQAPVVSSLGQLYIPWANPLQLENVADGIKVTPLLHSSAQSWQQTELGIVPDLKRYPTHGFAPAQQQESQLLGVMLEGRFTSAFKGKQPPMLQTAKSKDNAADEPTAATPSSTTPPLASLIEHSADSARLIVLGSAMLFSDEVNSLIAQALGSEYSKNFELMQNLVDWSLDDPAMLSMRSRGHYAHTLLPLSQMEQQWLEWGLYLISLVLLVLVGILAWWLRQRRYQRYQQWLAPLQVKTSPSSQ